jgi:hypothetical protein
MARAQLINHASKHSYKGQRPDQRRSAFKQNKSLKPARQMIPCLPMIVNVFGHA